MKHYGDETLSSELVKMDNAMKMTAKFYKWFMWFIVGAALLTLIPLDGDTAAGVSIMDRLIGCFVILLTLPILFYEKRLIQGKSKKYVYTIGPSLVLFLALFDISSYFTNSPTSLWFNAALYLIALIYWIVAFNDKDHKAYFSN